MKFWFFLGGLVVVASALFIGLKVQPQTLPHALTPAIATPLDNRKSSADFSATRSDASLQAHQEFSPAHFASPTSAPSASAIRSTDSSGLPAGKAPDQPTSQKHTTVGLNLPATDTSAVTYLDLSIPALQTSAPGGSGMIEEELEVPNGMPVPAALMDGSETPDSPRGFALDELASDLFDSVSNATKSGGSEAEAWAAARDLGNQSYRALYGNERAEAYEREAMLEVLNGSQ